MEKLYTYLMYDGKYHKIGQSKHPEKRLKQIKTGNADVKLICYGHLISEKYLHTRFYQNRIDGEWFALSKEQVEKAIELIIYGENYINSGRIYKHSLTWDNTIQKMMEGKLKSEKLSENYVINFGKYSGTPIKEMVSDEQYNYCKWLLKEMKSSMSRQEKHKSRKYKAFYWFIQNYDKITNLN